MNAFEQLMSRRLIIKAKDRDLYYEVKDELGNLKKFFTEKLGYQILVTPYLIKLEKIPAKPEAWMGIQEFTDKMEYVFFCMILMFLENMEAEEQFVLSSLTEYLQTQYREERLDWTVYHHRRHLVKVLKYCITNGLLLVNDGNEDSFAKDEGSEVLYENTGVSRYFIRNFTQDMTNYRGIEDFAREEWISVNEDRGIVRRQRVYRTLLMNPALYRTPETEEDYIYIKQYRAMVQQDLEGLTDLELQVHKNVAFLILGEDSRLGKGFPEENSLSDIVLLFCSILQEELDQEKVERTVEDRIVVSQEHFLGMLEKCKSRFESGFAKGYREMTTAAFAEELETYMERMGFLRKEEGEIVLMQILGKMTGYYPEDFEEAKKTKKAAKKKKKTGGKS